MSRFYLAAPRRCALMLGFSGFPPQVIKPAAARLAAIIARTAAVTPPHKGEGNAPSARRQ